MRHAFRFSLGIFLVVLGIIGWILPIVPGWPFLIPGLIILGDYIPAVKRLVGWAKTKVPESIWKKPPKTNES